MNTIDVCGLTKEYPGFTLDNISFHVRAGSVTGFVGINGSGKTTTIKCILNLIHQDKGLVKIFGKEYSSQTELDIKNDIGVVLDNDYLFQKMTIEEIKNIASHAYKKWDENIYKNLLEKFELPPKKRIESLSKGMKMKLSLLLAFSHHAKLLIMDEPTSGLYPFARQEFSSIIKKFTEEDPNNSVLFSSHITGDLENLADEIVFVHRGRLIFQRPMTDIKSSGRTIENIMLDTIGQSNENINN